MQWAEARLCDDIGHVCVWMFSVCEVEVSLSDVNHLRLLHRQRANAAGNFHRQLVLHRENLDHHRLDPQTGEQLAWQSNRLSYRDETKVSVSVVTALRPDVEVCLTHICLWEVGGLLAVRQRDVKGVFKLLLSWVLVVDLTLDQISLQETVHWSSCMNRSPIFTTHRHTHTHTHTHTQSTQENKRVWGVVFWKLRLRKADEGKREFKDYILMDFSYLVIMTCSFYFIKNTFFKKQTLCLHIFILCLLKVKMFMSKEMKYLIWYEEILNKNQSVN